MGLSRFASFHPSRARLPLTGLTSRWQFRKQLTVSPPRDREYEGAARSNGGADKLI